VLGKFVTARSLHVNYLLGVGPTSDGEFVDGIYENMAIVGAWMKKNRAAIAGTKPLPAEESASVPATSAGAARYLFLVPELKEGGKREADILPATDLRVTLKGASKPKAVRLLADGAKLKHEYADGVLTIEVPAAKRSHLVDVVRV